MTTNKKTIEKKEDFGRPTIFNAELGLAITSRMCTGETLRSICREDAMPCRQSVHNWLLKAATEESSKGEKDFLYQYKVAQTISADEQFDEMYEIAFDGSQDFIMNKKGDVLTDHEHIARSKLIIETMKWRLSKMLPKKYGDKTMVDNTHEFKGGIIEQTAREIKEAYLKKIGAK